jgi:hypothetical protein
MNLPDLKTLQTPLAILALVLGAAAAAIYYTEQLLERAHGALAQQEVQLREARTRLYRSGEEREIISRYLGPYQQLQRIGFIGEEQRINWLDGLRVANQQTGLFGIDYEISAQRTYPYAGEFDPGRIALNQSMMKLRFRLLHEEDLLRFFNVLAQLGTGVFLLDECTLRRTDTSRAIRHQPNLAAECALSWITANPAAPGKKP